MSEGVITEIIDAQQQLPNLSRLERRRLLRRIMDEIMVARSYGQSNGVFADASSLERLIASTCNSIAEIASMDDVGFRHVLDEFAKLIITMRNLASPTPSAARVLH
jgi:hypothetical protein